MGRNDQLGTVGAALFVFVMLLTAVASLVLPLALAYFLLTH